MKLTNSDTTWGTPAKLFHWLVAGLVLTEFALGWIATSWRLSPAKLNLFVWHKSTGMLVLALVLLRLLWRIVNPIPLLPSDIPLWERAVARTSHTLLYTLMIAMPLVGWIINSAANIPFSVFWLIQLPSVIAPDKHIAELAALVHRSLFFILAALLVLHVTAALRHHFIKKNNLLDRMLPTIGIRK